MKKLLLVATIAILVLAAACNAIENRVNNKADIEIGTKVADTFLNYVKAKDYTKAMEQTKISPDNPVYQSHITNLTDLGSKLGNIVSFKQDTAYATVAQEGNTIEGTVTVKYKVDYTQGHTVDTYIISLSNDEAKIVSYNIINE